MSKDSRLPEHNQMPIKYKFFQLHYYNFKSKAYLYSYICLYLLNKELSAYNMHG